MANIKLTSTDLYHTIRLGRKIEQERKKRGLSMQQLANILETSASSVYHHECGQRALRVTHLYRYAKAFNIPVTQLLENTHE